MRKVVSSTIEVVTFPNSVIAKLDRLQKKYSFIMVQYDADGKPFISKNALRDLMPEIKQRFPDLTQQQLDQVLQIIPYSYYTEE